MAKFINTLGNASLAVALCDRCQCKFAITDLHPDPNSPGMMVCENDLDEYDPYRLEPSLEDEIHLPFARPDSDISLTAEEAQESQDIATEDGTWNPQNWPPDGWNPDGWNP